MARRKRYTRPDGLREKSVTIGGRRHVFRGHSENEIMQKIADFREREERGPTFEEMAGEWWEQHEPLIRHGTVHGYKAVSYTHLDVYKRQRPSVPGRPRPAC